MIHLIPAPTENWKTRAACRGRDPELWHSTNPADLQYAQDICLLDCQVRRDCGLFALRRNERWGIWAGRDMGEQREVERLASHLGVPLPPRRKTDRPALSFRCTECNALFTAPERREQCAPCASGRMPVQLVREFIDSLMSQPGMTYQRIADLAGPPVTRSWVAHMAAGRKQRTGKELAEKLFAVAAVEVAS